MYLQREQQPQRCGWCERVVKKEGSDLVATSSGQGPLHVDVIDRANAISIMLSSFEASLRAAVQTRAATLLPSFHAEGTDCYRLFHGAVEGSPGCTLDRYGVSAQLRP